MPGVQRWQFIDIASGEHWTVPINPNAMTSPFPARKYTVNATTAGPNGGTHVVYEALADPVPWTFSGTCLTLDHVNGLLAWSGIKNKIKIVDHFGRTFTVTLDQFDVIPAQVRSHMERHTYTMHATVYAYLPPGGTPPLPPGSFTQ